MRIVNVDISNFRGIKKGSFPFPKDERIICIIGSGDSCKSTLLKSIEWALWPSWNLVATDMDFYKGNTSEPIVIEVSVAEFIDALLNEEKYGLYLRDADAVISKEQNDEPKEQGLPVLTVRLTIDSSLEPKWEIVTNRSEPKLISHRDRQLLLCSSIGFDYEKDFLWGRNSVLQKYTNSKDTLHNAYTQVMRNAIKDIKLGELDTTASQLKDAGKQYGVSFAGEVHNRILMQNGSFSTMVGVFDGEVPFVQRGLGSKRLLSMGMHINISDGASVLLVDEIETGLEPYRICALINEFRRRHKNSGQIIMTTHSQNTITECSVNELHVISAHNGIVKLHGLVSGDAEVDETTQRIIRTEPAAFLCKRLIVCEGKTEVGLLRALDKYMSESKGKRFAYFGVGTALGGGGDKFFKMSYLLQKCGYEVSILMDSDLTKEEEEKENARVLHGIPVFDWEEGNALEEQLFSDSPTDIINKLLLIAIENKTYEHVKTKLTGKIPDEFLVVTEDSIQINSNITDEMKKMLGTIAKRKNSEWYKRIDLGEVIGDIILAQLDSFSPESRLITVLSQIESWVIADE